MAFSTLAKCHSWVSDFATVLTEKQRAILNEFPLVIKMAAQEVNTYFHIPVSRKKRCKCKDFFFFLKHINGAGLLGICNSSLLESSVNQSIKSLCTKMMLAADTVMEREGGLVSSLRAAAFPNCRSELPQGGTKETFNTS